MSVHWDGQEMKCLASTHVYGFSFFSRKRRIVLRYLWMRINFPSPFYFFCLSRLCPGLCQSRGTAANHFFPSLRKVYRDKGKENQGHVLFMLYFILDLFACYLIFSHPEYGFLDRTRGIEPYVGDWGPGWIHSWGPWPSRPPHVSVLNQMKKLDESFLQPVKDAMGRSWPNLVVRFFYSWTENSSYFSKRR